MKRSRVNQKSPIPIGRVLSNVMESFRRFAGQDMMRICDKWDEVVGEAVAANAQPALFKNHLLIVHTCSSSWSHQLRFSKADIINRLNDALECDLINDIRFRIGSVESPSGFDDSENRR